MTIPGEYRAARALDYFHQGYNCSQSVFTAFADVCGLSEETALRLSSPLGAGIGRMREVCGAFCGLSMVAGSLHGNTSPDTGEKEKIFSLVQSLAADFKKEFGTLYCRELLGLTPEQLAGETARPGDRTAAYYASRPCERCIAFCARLAARASCSQKTMEYAVTSASSPVLAAMPRRETSQPGRSASVANGSAWCTDCVDGSGGMRGDQKMPKDWLMSEMLAFSRRATSS